MNLATPSSLQKLQTALHDKAKGSPNFRFYAQFDKVHRKDVLAFAYQCCKANGGAAGVDGQRFEDIEEYGVERWLDELAPEFAPVADPPRKPNRCLTACPTGSGTQKPVASPSRYRSSESVRHLLARR